jgi:hypothetical protein
MESMRRPSRGQLTGHGAPKRFADARDMTRISQKERERVYLRLLQRLRPEVPAGVPEEPEPPDFAFRVGDSILGIEVTEYHNPQRDGRRPLQEQDALRRRAIEIAYDTFRASDTRALDVSVLFRPVSEFSKGDVTRIASALARVVAATPTASWEQVRLDASQAKLPDPVSTVFITEVPQEASGRWKHVFASSVHSVTPEDIHREIRRKEVGTGGYSPNIAELWLLIVQDYESRAHAAELTAEATEHVYETVFARVLFLNIFQNRVADLPVRREGAGAA